VTSWSYLVLAMLYVSKAVLVSLWTNVLGTAWLANILETQAGLDISPVNSRSAKVIIGDGIE